MAQSAVKKSERAAAKQARAARVRRERKAKRTSLTY